MEPKEIINQLNSIGVEAILESDDPVHQWSELFAIVSAMGEEGEQLPNTLVVAATAHHTRTLDTHFPAENIGASMVVLGFLQDQKHTAGK